MIQIRKRSVCMCCPVGAVTLARKVGLEVIHGSVCYLMRSMRLHSRFNTSSFILVVRRYISPCAKDPADASRPYCSGRYLYIPYCIGSSWVSIDVAGGSSCIALWLPDSCITRRCSDGRKPNQSKYDLFASDLTETKNREVRRSAATARASSSSSASASALTR